MLHFQIPTLILNDQIWTIFGLINTFGIKILFLLYCWKSGYNIVKTIYLLAAVTTGSAIGSVIFPSFLGALVGAAFSAVVTIRYLAIRDNYFGPLAVMALATLAISRIGCLLSGCCFGSVAGDFPGIIYGAQSFAHIFHSELGLTHDSHSLPVHPIQLYESLWLMIGAVIVHRTGKKVSNGLTMIPLALSFLFAGRFFVEFTRDMTNIWWSVRSFAGLSYLQWFCAFAAISSIVLFMKFRNSTPRLISENERSPIPLVALLFITVAALQYRIVDQLVIQLSILLPTASILAFSPLFTRIVKFRPIVQAVAVVLQIVPILPRTLQVIAEDENSDSSKTWLYEVDTSHKKLVRVGQTEDSPEKIDSVRTKIGLYSDSAAPVTFTETAIEPLSPTMPKTIEQESGARQKQLIVRGTTGYFKNSYTEYVGDQSCGGPSITRTYHNMIPGVGVSIGSKIIEPNKPTVQFTGDLILAANEWKYSYEHSSQEIEDTTSSGTTMFNSFGGSCKIDGNYVGGGFGLFITSPSNIPYKTELFSVVPRFHFRAGAPKYHFWSDVGGIESAILYPAEIRVGQGHKIGPVYFRYGNWIPQNDFGGFIALKIPTDKNGSIGINASVAAETNSFGVSYEKGIPIKSK